MSVAEFVDLTSAVAMGLLCLGLLLTVIRIIVGPTIADRVLALDLMTIVAMSLVGAMAVRTGLTIYLDIAIALALVGFLATVALARYLLRRHEQQVREQEQ